MTLEEKISHLRVQAMEEARGEGNAIMKQHEEALENLARQHMEEMERQSQTRIKAEKVRYLMLNFKEQGKVWEESIH